MVRSFLYSSPRGYYTHSSYDGNSVVDDYIEQIYRQRDLKKDPRQGLDPEFIWISISALMLIGILKCKGTDSEKAAVFYRVVQPEMTPRVLVKDRDIRMSIFFLTNLTTILEFMQVNMVKSRKTGEEGGIDLDYYKKKMDDYEVVFDAINEEF